MATPQVTSAVLAGQVPGLNPMTIDYWSIKYQVRDIRWSPQKQLWIAYLHIPDTAWLGAMEVCLDCVSVHRYRYCNGTWSKTKWYEPCAESNQWVHCKNRDTVEINNRFVQNAIDRTHRKKEVYTYHGIRVIRGYDPNIVPHYRHVSWCFRGTSPEYIIQGSGGLSNSIYYRRCDGRFRNLGHQVLKTSRGAGQVEQTKPEKSDNTVKKEEGDKILVRLVRSPSGTIKETEASIKENHRKNKRTRSLSSTGTDFILPMKYRRMCEEHFEILV